MSTAFIFSAILTIAALAVFEIVNSLDNAVVNSNILCRIKSPKARAFFVTWGMFFSVFLVRGLVPFVLYYIPNAKLGFKAVLNSFWSGDPAVKHAVELMAPNLLMSGGIFLSMLFLHWLLVEEKDLGYAFEVWLSKRGSSWFFGAVGALMATIGIIVRTTMHDPNMALNLLLSAVIGMAAFFGVDAIKEYAETTEEKLIDDSGSGPAMSDWAKVLLLEVIDASFSMDGVIGAFAFTLVIPFILIGNGIGAYIVRRLTLGEVDKIANFKLLANGAFYSIGSLSVLMMAEGFGIHVPQYVSPLITFSLVGLFFWKSVVYNREHPEEVVTQTGDNSLPVCEVNG